MSRSLGILILIFFSSMIIAAIFLKVSAYRHQKKLDEVASGVRRAITDDEQAYFLGHYGYWINEPGTNRMQQIQKFVQMWSMINKSSKQALTNAIDCVLFSIKIKDQPLGKVLAERFECSIVLPEDITEENKTKFASMLAGFRKELESMDPN